MDLIECSKLIVKILEEVTPGNMYRCGLGEIVFDPWLVKESPCLDLGWTDFRSIRDTLSTAFSPVRLFLLGTYHGSDTVFYFSASQIPSFYALCSVATTLSSVNNQVVPSPVWQQRSAELCSTVPSCAPVFGPLFLPSLSVLPLTTSVNPPHYAHVVL